VVPRGVPEPRVTLRAAHRVLVTDLHGKPGATPAPRREAGNQVTSNYTPYNGYYPLAPWAGLAVLAGYALLALTVAAVLLRRRDA
jgi:uncharacterized membrane protein